MNSFISVLTNAAAQVHAALTFSCVINQGLPPFSLELFFFKGLVLKALMAKQKLTMLVQLSCLM